MVVPRKWTVEMLGMEEKSCYWDISIGNYAFLNGGRGGGGAARMEN